MPGIIWQKKRKIANPIQTISRTWLDRTLLIIVLLRCNGKLPYLLSKKLQWSSPVRSGQMHSSIQSMLILRLMKALPYTGCSLKRSVKLATSTNRISATSTSAFARPPYRFKPTFIQIWCIWRPGVCCVDASNSNFPKRPYCYSVKVGKNRSWAH